MEQHVKEAALAERWALSIRTLQRWRWQGKGPPYLKLGQLVVYRLSDVVAWEEANLRRNSTPTPKVSQ
jgi:hypothetical protein